MYSTSARLDAIEKSGLRSSLEADHPHEQPVRARREVHAAEVDPLVIERQLASPDGV
jgi:hypothetical protein